MENLNNLAKMAGAAIIPVVVMTLLWLAVGAVAPCFAKGPNKRYQISYNRLDLVSD